MPANIDVLVVTATRVETLAVTRAFEGATDRQIKPLTLADRVYVDLGEINGLRVLMLQTEMGSSGLGASQQAVEKAITTLRPRAVIMVGIAFGVDDSKQVIGEILVSQQLWLYELQRVGTDDRGGRRIVSRGDRPHASPTLLNYFRSAHNHWTGPPVTFGLILSGDKLVDNFDFRQQLREFEPGAIGGDMEGAGLYVACQATGIDWILVKAICDWGDGHKAIDKALRQDEAARNSAEFVLFALKHAPLPGPGQQRVASISASADLTSDTGTQALAVPRVIIREASAAEILGHLKGLTPASRFSEQAKDLYVGRWTREAGWQATVRMLPSQVTGGEWHCTFEEVSSGAVFFANTVRDLSTLRPGDSVTVSGRIREVSVLEYVSLENAIVRVVPLS